MWLRCLGAAGESRAAQVVCDALTGEGVVVPESAPAVGRIGVVVVDTITEREVSFVRAAAADGERRVLVVVPAGASVDVDASWQLMSAGAADVIVWDRSDDPASDAVERLRRWQQVDALMDSAVVTEELVGRSPAWRRVLRQIVEIAHFTTLSLLITGESGTGKELVARLVHALDPRPDKGDLVVLDCTTVVPSLSGSEFFGHERGAFTGAVAQRVGAFGQADGGTLFLDEVGELPLQLQAELLRVVQEGTYKRVGGNTWHRTTFRLICATNRNLLDEERRGTFRRDFYHRIAAWRCALPSLRERTRDILPLAEHFAALQEAVGGFDPAVIALLTGRPYPGNVRDLRTLVERIAQRHVGNGPITVGDVPDDERPPDDAWETWRTGRAFEAAVMQALAGGASLKEIGDIARDTAVRMAVAQEDGNLKRAARILTVSERALQLRRAAQLQEG